ncbi:sigma-70 family RNA polymerase sigma factor [Ructibacterium gallinarum]|uniref:Sigma-70 family RNA polymerase sigma factor n=1 Tax=Ructibacterium gallinarum TaxID=2779355 RepID=A0A9D5LY51_9FIRM|nr:sigma-70 family RNA polymerase sigma factor [Ructibacterium gallinarum]
MFGFLFQCLQSITLLLSYLSGNHSFPKPLTAEEERECLLRCQQGDIEARNKLIEHNLRLVAHIAKKYTGSVRDHEDILSVGTIGLIKGISSFDPSKGTRLATYAARCVDKPTLSSWLFLRLKGKDLLLFQKNGGCYINFRICI